MQHMDKKVYKEEFLCGYLQTGLKGGAHQLVMWSTVIQDTQVNVEPEDVEQSRNNQETHDSAKTLHAHTQLHKTHTVRPHTSDNAGP